MLLRLIRDFWRQYGPSAHVPKRPPNELKRWNDEFRPAGEGLRSRLLEDLGRWIERHPRDAQAWAQRGDWLSRLHRYPEAEDDFRRALRLDPNFPAAQEGIGWVLLKLGRLDEAYLHLETAHKKQPGDADILVHWGLVCLEKGDLAQAGEKFQRAIDRSPRNAHAWHNLGLVALQSGDVTQGIAYIRRSIECDPMLGVAYSNLALACRDAQMLDAGLVEARRAVELKPDDARCRVILGDLLTDAGDFTAALQALDEAARLAPEDAGMRVGRGKLFMACGRYDEAVAVFELVLKSDPEDAEAAAGLGQLRLLQGRFGTGWALYDARRRTATAQMRAFRQPLWQGEELRGKTLLVHAEQGLGDIILFSSCLPDVISQAAHVIVETYPRLAALMQRSFPDATVVSHDVRGAGTAWLNALPPVDFQTPIGSLPRWLRPSRAAFSPHAGYLRADAGRVERLRHQLTQIGPGLKLGITWRGGLARTAGLQRSIELQGLLTTLAPLGAQLVSLQHDATAEEIAQASEACGTTLTHWAEEVADQDAAAALTCALDAVVTVCQTQAHLTGALGRPGCVLVPRHPNWRYGLEGDSVPWYPDLHLLRQRDAGDWGPTLSAAAHWVTQRQSEVSARRAESKA
jgi:tetratricopeptide (TPR) repeat protein